MLLSTERLSGSKRSAHGSLEYDTFPVLKSGIGSGDRNKDKTKTRRHIFQNDFPMPCTVREIDENRPETPIVKTRHERHLLALNGKAGNGRPILPRDTKDVYSSNGMYKRKLAATPCNNILSGKNGNRCPTPVPFQQPLTRLCWDNAGNKDSDDEDNYPHNLSNVRFTPRTKITNSHFRKIKKNNDVTLSDIDDVHEFGRQTEHLHLTQKVLQSYFRKKVDSTQRIVKWLVDCEEKSNVTSLPAHLPNIAYRHNSAHVQQK